MFKKSNKNIFEAFLLVEDESCVVVVYSKETGKLQFAKVLSGANAVAFLATLEQELGGVVVYNLILSLKDYCSIELEQSVDYIGALDTALPWLCVDYLERSPDNYYYSDATSIDAKKPRVYAALKDRVKTIIQRIKLENSKIKQLLFYDVCISNYVSQLPEISQPFCLLVASPQQVRLLQVSLGSLRQLANLPTAAAEGYEVQLFLNQLKALCKLQSSEKSMLVVLNNTLDKLPELSQETLWQYHSLELSKTDKLFEDVKREEQHLLAAILGAGKYYYG